ncbi:MAG: hypothetical protein ACFFAO_10885, partial [Candidatus Hermodarchaeota archaeon]
GQSLTKLAYLNEEGDFNLILLPTKSDFVESEKILESVKNGKKIFNFTGGKAFKLYKKFSNEFNSNLLDEFESNAKGIEALYRLYKKKDLPNSLIINIGTGTSILLKDNSINHLGGSALGGGFFMGLIRLLYNLKDFKKALDMAESGDRYSIDLKVSDIYELEDNRVDSIFREFTASSLGKIGEFTSLDNIKREDLLNALICIIGENIGIIANLYANNNNIKNIVFCGGFLRENNILKRILSAICKMNKKKPIFLKNSEFCGAIGALLS